MSGSVDVLLKRKRGGDDARRGDFQKKQNWHLDAKTGEVQEFAFPSCCHTSDMQNRRHVCEDRKKPKEEDRMTDDLSQPQTRFDMFEVLHVL